jgi:hypothetical protein
VLSATASAHWGQPPERGDAWNLSRAGAVHQPQRLLSFLWCDILLEAGRDFRVVRAGGSLAA